MVFAAKGGNSSNVNIKIVSYFKDFTISFFYDSSSSHTSIIEEFSETKWMMINLQKFEIEFSATSFFFRYNDDFSIIVIPGKAAKFFQKRNSDKIEIFPDKHFEIYKYHRRQANVYFIENTKMQGSKELFIYEYMHDSKGLIEQDVFALYSFNKNGWLYNNAIKFIDILCFKNFQIMEINK